MTCSQCGRDLVGNVVVRGGVTGGGIPAVSIEPTADRNWICCDACNAVLCHHCCQYPESGYCDNCIRRYHLRGYLKKVGLIRGKKGGSPIMRKDTRTGVREAYSSKLRPMDASCGLAVADDEWRRARA